MTNKWIIVRQDKESIGALGTERLQLYWTSREKRQAQEVCDLLNNHLKKKSTHRYALMLYDNYLAIKS